MASGLFRKMIVGAGTMYLMDPDRGRRRRALLRDKFHAALSRTSDYTGKAGKDLAHRSLGMLAEMRARVAGEPCTDEVLEARVRAQIGRACSHPGGIEVKARQGRIMLAGPILAHEADEVMRTVRRVRGVRGIENRLERHRNPGDIPGLQGGHVRRRRRLDLARDHWAPATRLLAGCAGGSLLAYGLARRGIAGAMAGGLGGGLLLRAATNLPARRILGIGAGRRAIDVHKTINIDAPIEDVFNYWAHFENFPKFMSHVREVRDLGQGRSRWTVAGPAGSSFSFTADITEFIPGRLLAWRTEPGSAVDHAGMVRFDANENGGTRIDIRMSYNPVAGALGHAVARLFGSDPLHAMHEDMVRLKSLIEHGKASAPGKQARREDVAGAAGVVPERIEIS